MTVIFVLWISGVFLIAAFWSCYQSGYHLGCANTYEKCRKELPELLTTAEQLGACKVVREMKKVVEQVADARLRESLRESLFNEGECNAKERLH